MDWSDKRPLSELVFAIDSPEEQRADLAARVSSLLAGAGVRVADDIDALGCTGLVASGVLVDEAKFVRGHLGGCGHALPCFIAPDRFCLVHEVIGGLQENQAVRHPEWAVDISRPLTAEEKAKLDLIERARRVDGPSAHARATKTIDLLAGREQTDQPEPAAVDPTPVLDAPTTTTAWKCPEHEEIQWGCRFCLAAEVATGPFEPRLLVLPAWIDRSATTDNLEPIPPAEMAPKIAALDDADVHAIGVFVQATRFERKLVRGW